MMQKGLAVNDFTNISLSREEHLAHHNGWCKLKSPKITKGLLKSLETLSKSDIITPARECTLIIFKVRQWSTKNWCFEERFDNSLKNNIIRCKKLVTIASGRKNVAWSFVKQKQVSTSSKCNSNSYFSALVLTCFRLTKGRATFFRPETIVASFLHLMVLLFKVLLTL